MKNPRLAIAPLLLVLAAACEPSTDAVFSAQAKSPEKSVVYELTGSHIPESAGEGQIYEYY